MRVALVSIGNCPSLALRNIRRYCLVHADVRDRAEISLHDYDLRQMRDAREQSAQRWAWVTRIDEAVRELTGPAPDLVAFSCYLWSTELSLHLAHLLKRMRPEVRVLFGGPDAGPRAEELLGRHPEVDWVVDGDGEIPVLALLRQMLSAEPDLRAVPSLRYRDGAELVANPPPAERLDLALLAGAWEEVPSPEEMGAWHWPNLLYETLRGCPYACSYCMYGKTKMNEKPVDLVVGELAGLLETGLIVEIIDPTFTTYRQRAKEILRRLAALDYRGKLYFEAYPDSIDEEMAELMARSRVTCVGIGLQTASTEGLKAVRRPKNLERFERAVRLLTEHGIRFYVDVIYGLPRTTLADFFATIDYLYETGVPSLVMYRLLGLPGSPMMEDQEKYGLVFSRYPPYELLSSDDWTLDEIAYCDRFQRGYEAVAAEFRDGDAGAAVAAAGGISAVVRRFLESGLQPAAYRDRELGALSAPTRPSRRRRGTPAATSPASRRRGGTGSRAAASRR